MKFLHICLNCSDFTGSACSSEPDLSFFLSFFCSIKTSWTLQPPGVDLLCVVWLLAKTAAPPRPAKAQCCELSFQLPIYSPGCSRLCLSWIEVTPSSLRFLLTSSGWLCVPHRGHRRHRDPGGRLLEHRQAQLPARPHVPGKPGQCFRRRHR